ncbi:MAG TPA: IPT/TIG domain-containing protein, partial [Longimicrobiales bacterium]
MHIRLRRRPASFAAALLACVAFSACDDGPSGPDRGYTIRVRAGDDQFAGFGQQLETPLQVTVEDAGSGATVQGVQVQWTVVEGSGAELGSDVSITDANGVAWTTLVLGPVDAAYRVRATVRDLVGSPATFEATAVAPAHVDSIAPAAAQAGDTVFVHGTGFAPGADDNTVLVAGFRARVLEATTTRLRIVVPACVPDRFADVTVNRGIVASNVVSLEVAGSGDAPLAIDVGQVVRLADAEALDCVRLGGGLDARYLLVLQNASEVPGRELPWRLTGAAPGLVAAPDGSRMLIGRTSLRATPLQLKLDLELRELEADAAQQAALAPTTALSRAAPAVPLVGDRRDFWVFRRAGEYERVTAVVRHVSDHAILYEDLDAPEGGFQPGDFQAFGEIFDDPIQPTLVDVFGEPSDVDGNDRIIILFTPVVNRMTPPGSGTSYVA